LRESRRQAAVKQGLLTLLYAYLFFLCIDMMGGGMKASFKHALKDYLQEHAGDFNELVSFVIGLIGTTLVQSSSTVTSMAVVLVQENIVPVMIAIGIVHGANLGTSTTSSIVAFVSETPPLTGNVGRDAWNLLSAARSEGFHRAVSTAVVHGLFNIVLVTGILVLLELPFGIVHSASEWTATQIGESLAAGGVLVELLDWVSPKTYTKPVVSFLLSDLKLPGWSLVIAALLGMFGCLKGFSSTVKALLLSNTDTDDVEALGQKLIGRAPLDTFARGLLLTVLVQSSSATTSLVVPLAGMGFFSVRRIFPFILGANIGTCVTALLAAASGVGEPGFEPGLTIAFSHLYLNTLAVIIVVITPGVLTSVITLSEWLADAAVRLPAALLIYLAVLSVALPAVVWLLPMTLAAVGLAVLVAVMLVLPHVWRRDGTSTS
jgi:sodium-dependent phosphate cotransporter